MKVFLSLEEWLATYDAMVIALMQRFSFITEEYAEALAVKLISEKYTNDLEQIK